MKLFVKQANAHLLQRRSGCQQLSNDVCTVALFVYHTLQSTHLSLDPLQPVHYLLVRGTVLVFDGLLLSTLGQAHLSL